MSSGAGAGDVRLIYKIRYINVWIFLDSET